MPPSDGVPWPKGAQRTPADRAKVKHEHVSTPSSGSFCAEAYAVPYFGLGRHPGEVRVGLVGRPALASAGASPLDHRADARLRRFGHLAVAGRARPVAPAVPLSHEMSCALICIRTRIHPGLMTPRTRPRGPARPSLWLYPDPESPDECAPPGRHCRAPARVAPRRHSAALQAC